MREYRSDDPAVEALLDRLERIAGLKEVIRTGWVLRGVRDPESVADHSWGTAQLSLLLCPPDLDRERVLEIALVHDLAEVETGDIPRRVSPGARQLSAEEKELRERRAMGDLLRPLLLGRAGDNRLVLEGRLEEVRLAWEEYARGETGEARFVRDMNLVDLCLQAVIYQRGRRYDPETHGENFPDFTDLDEFFATSRDRFGTELGKTLYERLWARYRTIRDEGEGVAERGSAC